MRYLTSAKRNVEVFVETLVAHGLREVIVSPGSRNAPLTIAMDSHPKLNCRMIHDERSAGFFAMGVAQQIGEPVALICTSGSAVLNYYPAVSEAFYQGIPLLVISADRPQEWINHGDGQTIMQDEVFGKHVRSFLQLDDRDEMQSKEYVRDQTLSIMQKANGPWKGPVHINFSLEEPLYQTRERELEELLPRSERGIIEDAYQLSASLINKWKVAKKKMILCGQMNYDERLLLQLERLAEDSSVLVLVENTSNLVSRKFVHCIDRTIEGMELKDEQYRPDILITLGGAIVSKKVKNLLRGWAIDEHWRVGFAFPEMDTYRHLTESLVIEASDVISAINRIEVSEIPGDYQNLWKGLDYRRQEKGVSYLQTIGFSDLKFFELILDCIPEHSHLHLGNSSVVRYAQLFDPIKSVRYYANRGTSGIDGSMSTAAGHASMSTADWHVHITGDISFFYDSNALWNAHLTPNFRIVLVNNGGGGIFKIIPGPNSTEQYNTLFVAEHTHTAEYVCKTFMIDYLMVQSEQELMDAMEPFWTFEKEGRPKLLEINTTQIPNEEILADFFHNLQE